MGKAAVVAWIMVGAGNKELIGVRKWRRDWWGRYLERRLQLPFFGSKARFLSAFEKKKKKKRIGLTD